MYIAFFLVGLSLFVLATWGLVKRFKRMKKKRFNSKKGVAGLNI